MVGLRCRPEFRPAIQFAEGRAGPGRQEASVQVPDLGERGRSWSQARPVTVTLPPST